ncbi:MAG: bifunctional folylpolyglutamate synthase/dihydrofolate synthase [Chloroflexi bacterium]|nr:bifunctional folylpolyglutamate synthase/dihydrofolate synthase [Chloroflexota bacterium]
MDYRQALEIIFQRMNFERLPQPPYAERVYRLERMRELLQALGNPQQRYPAVHIAGTKGKGSVTAFVESVLRAAGYRTGMYTSPHLHTFRERIRIMGEPASEEQICRWMDTLQPILATRPEVTVFEAITALAMFGFAESPIEIGVFEVGIGGRLDATNVLAPLVSIITPISLDHIGVLGNTIAAIAHEKAGIIKPGVPVVSSPQTAEALEVIRQVSAQRSSRLDYVPDKISWQMTSANLQGQWFTLQRCETPSQSRFFIPLLGEHQLENAATAFAAVDALRHFGINIPDEAIERGFRDVQWPGRMEVLSEGPLVVVDGAHNEHSLTRLLTALRSYLTYKKMILIFGVSSTHTPLDLLQIVVTAADTLILTQAAHNKAYPVAELAAHAASLGILAHASTSVAQALQLALAQAEPDDLIIITGSLFVVAEARTAWFTYRGLPPPPSDPEGVY